MKKKSPWQLCRRHKNKRIYKNEAQALHVLLNSNLKQGRFYKCPVADHWHITSKKLK